MNIRHHPTTTATLRFGVGVEKGLNMKSIVAIYGQVTDAFDRVAAPIFDLSVRIMIGLVFFRSGMQKLDDWESTIFLFQEEYKVPLLPPEIAAVLGTFNELVMPVLLFLGLAARLAVLPLIGMTLVIQFVLGATNPSYDNVEHYYWLALLGMILVRGPGRLSLDHIIRTKFNPPA